MLEDDDAVAKIELGSHGVLVTGHTILNDDVVNGMTEDEDSRSGKVVRPGWPTNQAHF